jgi:hypothetical protein
MTSFPNRVYYPELKAMDADGLQNTLFNVLLYALLELISLVLLDIVLRRLVQFSPVSQLAFVLRTQWKMVQSKLVLWVLYVVQSSLVHCGTCLVPFIVSHTAVAHLLRADYSFKFAWLTKS